MTRQEFLSDSYKIEILDSLSPYGIVFPWTGIVEAHLYGAGGGGGGNDAGIQGGRGAAGQYCRLTMKVQAGDRAVVIVGGGGQAGDSNTNSSGRGLGGTSALNLFTTNYGLIPSLSGANGGNAGTAGSSGAGGGGGGATALLLNSLLVAIAGGGAGAGGGGIRGAGQSARNQPTSLNTNQWNGEKGDDKVGDGGGGGGAAGGFRAHSGGRDTGTLDSGGASGFSADCLIANSPNIIDSKIIYGSGINPVPQVSELDTMYFSSVLPFAKGGLPGRNGTNGAVILVYRSSGMLVKDQNQWKSISDIFVKRQSVWKKVQDIYVKQNGSWKNLNYSYDLMANQWSGLIGRQFRIRNAAASTADILIDQIINSEYWQNPFGAGIISQKQALL